MASAWSVRPERRASTTQPERIQSGGESRPRARDGSPLSPVLELFDAGICGSPVSGRVKRVAQ
jgi:hypothetical protein